MAVLATRNLIKIKVFLITIGFLHGSLIHHFRLFRIFILLPQNLPLTFCFLMFKIFRFDNVCNFIIHKSGD